MPAGSAGQLCTHAGERHRDFGLGRIGAGDSSGEQILIDPASGGALYAWGDATYQDLVEFRTATGQGGHDPGDGPDDRRIHGVALRSW